jgi:hypothetical protein
LLYGRDGKVNLGVELPGVELETYGTVAYDMATKSVAFNLSGSLDFYYDKKALEIMTEGINKTAELSGVDIDRTTLSQAVTEKVSKEEAENLKAEYTLNGSVKKLPKELNSAIYFTNLKLTWDERTYGFISKPISAIVAVDGTPVFKDFTVRMLINYTEAGDRGNTLGYLVELPGGERPGDYYFYRFQRVKKDTDLNIITSDKALQNYILELKDDKKKGKNIEFELKNKNAAVYLEEFTRFWGN